MQQYFVKGSAVSPVTIEDKETSKHMFQVMRLKEGDEVTLVFEDGIKRLARVLDVGTGSGVLSIASSLLGAKEIFAYDLDDVAVRVAQENIELNPCMENIHVAPGDLLKGVEIEADVIVANILADIIIHLTEDAYRLVKDEGYLIMSGIIKDKWEMVRESAEAAGFFLETHMIQGEWNACVFKKTKDISGVIGG